MHKILFLSFLLSFLTTFLVTPLWIKKAKRAEEVAEMGGICVAAGFLVGVFFYIGITTFYFNGGDLISLYLFACLCTILIITLVGAIDDILGWKIGLRQWQKPVLTLSAALPIMVINAGQSVMSVPLLGQVDFGLLYPLIIIPVGIAGAANGFNMLAGYNGLEAGMGIIILSVMGFVAWQSGLGWVSMLAFCMVFALIAFLKYNWYPAKIFPGDTLTYSVGALIACVAILGNMERIAVILFVPYYITFILKAWSRFKAESFAKVNKDGSLDMPYKSIYDLTHFAIVVLRKMKKKVYERDVVMFIFGIELVIVAVVWVLYL
jgi:UDP-N-acetylglucosamine--dolichyl-phosphate N-acetylglucosaminephosphotransferase